MTSLDIMTAPEEQLLPVACLLEAVAKQTRSIAIYMNSVTQHSATPQHVDEMVDAFQNFLKCFAYFAESRVTNQSLSERIPSGGIRLARELCDFIAVLQSQLAPLECTSQPDESVTNVESRQSSILAPFYEDDNTLAVNGVADGWRPIHEPIEPEAMIAILPHLAADFERSTRALASSVADAFSAFTPDLWSDSAAAIYASIQDIEQVLHLDHIDAGEQPLPTVSAREAVRSVTSIPDYAAAATKDLNQLVKDGWLLAVTDWTGEVRYPEFQFEVHIPTILHQVLPGIPPLHNPWSIGMFLKENVHHERISSDENAEAQVSDIIESLKLIGQWKPDSEQGPTDEELNVLTKNVARAERHETRLPSTLYQVLHKGDHLFRHVSSPRDAGADSREFLTAGLLTPSLENVGVCYYAGTPDGAWAEALMHHPSLSLEDILELSFYRFDIRPIGNRSLQGMKVTDLAARQLASGAMNERRAVTRALADKLIEKFQTRIGAAYTPRTGPTSGEGSGPGYAIWGPTTSEGISPARLSATHPFKPGPPTRGRWDHKPEGTPGLEDGAGFGAYLTRRLQQDGDTYPIALWRFPSPGAMSTPAGNSLQTGNPKIPPDPPDPQRNETTGRKVMEAD